MPPSTPALQRLAQRLRELREQKWPEYRLTQAALAGALGDVAAATISSWESSVAPKLAPSERLKAYAQFFATHRSIEGDTPVLLPIDTFSEDEQAVRKALEDELLALREEVRQPVRRAHVTTRRSLHFPDASTLTIVCAQLPSDQVGAFADPADPNYTELQSFADLDALVELFGHVRAENPRMQVNFRTAPNVVADDLSGHLVLLGGIVWNEVTQRLSEIMSALPVRQIQDPAVETGEIFTIDDGKRKFLPRWGDDAHKVLTEDVGLLVRAPNPFNSNRALVICNGIHSRGVLAAVRSLTDAALRESNERYIAENFADVDSFAILMRVLVIGTKALTPDFSAAGSVLYQWP